MNIQAKLKQISQLQPKEAGNSKLSEYGQGYSQAILDVLAILTEEEEVNESLEAVNQGTGDINALIDKFKAVNPSYERLFANKNQRAALERMVKKYGYAKLARTIDVAAEVFGQEFAPTITTPLQLERDLGKLVSYVKKNTPKNNTIVKI